jgi:ribosomal protein S18 acetylase RimI-like enzyme
VTSGIRIRRARPEDCDVIAEMVRRLARDTHQSTVPKATGDDLRAEAFSPSPIVSLWVAEKEGAVVGALVGSTIYSTWRAGRGLYVVDLFVADGHRGDRVGERLLVEATRAAVEDGARFVKLEVVAGNDGASRFYRRLGFAPVAGDVNWILEGEDLATVSGR